MSQRWCNLGSGIDLRDGVETLISRPAKEPSVQRELAIANQRRSAEPSRGRGLSGFDDHIDSRQPAAIRVVQSPRFSTACCYRGWFRRPIMHAGDHGSLRHSHGRGYADVSRGPLRWDGFQHSQIGRIPAHPPRSARVPIFCIPSHLDQDRGMGAAVTHAL